MAFDMKAKFYNNYRYEVKAIICFLLILISFFVLKSYSTIGTTAVISSSNNLTFFAHIPYNNYGDVDLLQYSFIMDQFLRPSWIKIVPDDCVNSIRVNSISVDLRNYSSLCDSWEGI